MTRSMHRVGEHTMWKDFENKNVELREFSSRRSLGVVYLMANQCGNSKGTLRPHLSYKVDDCDSR